MKTRRVIWVVEGKFTGRPSTAHMTRDDAREMMRCWGPDRKLRVTAYVPRETRKGSPK